MGRTKLKIGDLVRFAHMDTPAGRITKAEDDPNFSGGQKVEIEGWAGEFGVSGLLIWEPDDDNREPVRKCYGCDEMKLFRGEFCDQCLEAWAEEPPEIPY